MTLSSFERSEKSYFNKNPYVHLKVKDKKIANKSFSGMEKFIDAQLKIFKGNRKNNWNI